MPEDDCAILWVQAFESKSPDEWADHVVNSNRDTKINVSRYVAELLHVNVKTLEIWRFRIFEGRFTFCIRLPKAKSDNLIDSKNKFLFARHFVKKGDCAPEDDVGNVWANKIHTIHELSVITDTLAGIRGFVANLQGLGVRVEKPHIACARAALQTSSSTYIELNNGVLGKKKFWVSGWAITCARQTVVTALANPTTDSRFRMESLACHTNQEGCARRIV